MSFGEHLEELRIVLIRSLMGLAVCVGIGFLLSNYVIGVVVRPLEDSLKDYYLEHAAETILSEHGADLTTEERIEQKQTIKARGLMFEYVHFEQAELRRMVAIGEADAAEVSMEDSNVELGIPETRLVRVRRWRDISNRVQSISTTEPFFSWMKVGFITGLTIAAPWIFYQIWIFVAEGLYPTEKKYVYIYLPFSLILFVMGASMAYFFVFQPVLQFLLSFNQTMGAEPNLRISEWLSFFLMLPLGFGIGFQLPLVMLFLNRIGVISVEIYLSQWRIAILGIFVAAMLLTPSDPTSMMLLAIPLTILYFLGIGLCKWMPQRESPFGEAYDPE